MHEPIGLAGDPVKDDNPAVGARPMVEARGISKVFGSDGGVLDERDAFGIALHGHRESQ